jgi:hypothetical protein
MEMSALLKYLESKTPVYLGIEQVYIVDFFEEFNLVEVEDIGRKKNIVDIYVLRKEPYYEKSISFEYFMQWGE